VSGCRLEARELTKSFGGVTAVDNVSFTAEAGSITGIVGPNGAGKTTLFNLLTGIYAADRGQLVVGDAAVARSGWQPHKIARLGVARTFQSARVFPNLNVFDNVLVGAEAAYGGGSKGSRRRSAGELADEVSALLTALDLSERSRAPASTLPAGSNWPGCCSPGRRCCCSTSRPPACRRRRRPGWPTSWSRSAPSASP
jgi:branched-chain amino acid transport system ATP-binding protein